MNTRIVTANLATDLAKRLDELSRRVGRPTGWIVNKAIASYISREEKRHQLTLEALKDVDAGRTVEHTEVETWAKGLAGAKRRAYR